MFITIVLCIITALIGAGIVCFILIPKVKRQNQLNLQIKEENEYLEENNKILFNLSNELNKEISNKQNESFSLSSRIQALQESYTQIAEAAKISADEMYNMNMQLANTNFENDIEKLREYYLQATTEYIEEYEKALKECTEEWNKKASEYNTNLIEAQQNLSNLQSLESAAVAARKRDEEKKTQQDFYKIQLSDIDLQEIELIRSIAPNLRNAEPINKVIWKCYYEKPTNDLIGRVIGSGTHTGIYKITNLENGKCYVGQAASLADRWKQHIRRGLGAETATRNKLYPIMLSIGVENFSFEVIEECPRAQLNEREDFWQEYFKAIEFGYSIK